MIISTTISSVPFYLPFSGTSVMCVRSFVIVPHMLVLSLGFAQLLLFILCVSLVNFYCPSFKLIDFFFVCLCPVY